MLSLKKQYEKYEQHLSDYNPYGLLDMIRYSSRVLHNLEYYFILITMHKYLLEKNVSRMFLHEKNEK